MHSVALVCRWSITAASAITGHATTTDDGYDVEPQCHVAQQISVAVGIVTEFGDGSGTSSY
jgi:hypothetical protein